MKSAFLGVLFVMTMGLGGCAVHQNPPQSFVCHGPAAAAPETGCVAPGKWVWDCAQWQCIVPQQQTAQPQYQYVAPMYGYTYGPGYSPPVYLYPPASFSFSFGGGGGHGHGGHHGRR